MAGPEPNNGGRETVRETHFTRAQLLWGRRTERWINLFGHRSENSIADELLSPLKDRAFSEVQKNPLVQKIGGNLNEQLDRVNSELADKR